MTVPLITDFKFSENAYFYHVCGGGRLARDTVNSLCNQACFGRTAYWIGGIRNTLKGTPLVRYSMKIFKTSGYPTFLTTTDNHWKEEKVGYILIIEYNDFVAILKRNTASIKIKNLLEEIPYQTLLNMYMTPETKLSKMNMRNLDGSAYAMRSRILEASNLKQNVSAFGLNRYYLQSYKGESPMNGTFSLTMGSSRVNWHETGVDINDLCKWIVEVIDAIISYVQPSDDYLSIFAKPISYKEKRDVLVPDSALIYYNQLVSIIENPNVSIDILDKHCNVVSHDMKIVKCYLAKFDNTLSNVVAIPKRGVDHYYIGSDKNVEIVKGSSSILLQGSALNRIKINNHPEPSYNGSLCEIINGNSWFNIYFTDHNLYYSHKLLFQDHLLLSSAHDLLNNMEACIDLEHTNCEKRNVNDFRGMTDWDADSIFKYVENRFVGSFDHFVCDDFDDEWADHIGVSEGKISFYCSKHKGSKCSATDFQDIVGQALKNLGNMTPSSKSLSAKIAYWNSVHTRSNLQRYRSPAGNLAEMEQKWKKNISNPNTEREMCLVVDFISKNEFKTFVDSINVKPATEFTKASFQLLWLLSSFVASCKELGVKPVIYCKP